MIKGNLLFYITSSHPDYKIVNRSAQGVKIHADANAAWNILRKCKPSIGWCSGVVAYPENLKIVV